MILETPPYDRGQELVARLDELDAQVRSKWQVGDFVWPEEWIPADAMRDYWFLYSFALRSLIFRAQTNAARVY